MMKRKKFGLPVILPAFFLGGCASMQAELEGLEYPANTAILIGDVAYQINTIKCAQIKAIGEEGALDCRDAEGRQSASITPVSAWRRKLLKEQMGMEWASPAHQDFLFNFFHKGGKEQVAATLVSSAQQIHGTYAAVKNMSDSIDKSKSIDRQSAQMKADGAAAYMSGGMSAWQAHQWKVIQWRQDNARYFLNQANKSQLIGTD